MDWITHGLFGGACAAGLARRDEMRKAIGIGAVAGMMPDLDILIRSPTDPLLVLDFHRHFTHSLVFAPIGALIAALLAWLLLRQRLAFGRIYLFALLGYLPAGILDAFTSYGTHLLWPFSDERVAWKAIAVVDPLFSLIVLLGVALAAWRQTPWPPRIALACAALYLAFGWSQRERVEALAREVAAERGHAVERLEVKPTMGNLLLWRIVYESDGDFHVDAARVWPGSPTRWYAGTQVARLQPADLPLPPGSVQARDVARFDHFSAGWLALHPDDPLVIGDLRYAGVPNGVRPVWGIRIDPHAADRHVRFETFRDFSREERQMFLQMLRGVPPESLPSP